MRLLLLQFNNYFNRIIKKYSTVEDYISNSSNHQYTEIENFNPRDGINTDRVINFSSEWSPDYLLVVNENNKIVSRWFVTLSVFIRGGQYRLSLKRDTVAEKYDIIVKSPCFVQKGFVNEENPLIYNREDFNCNQIKVGEKLISDESNFSWLVLYYNLSLKNDEEGVMSGSVSTTSRKHYIIDVATIEDWDIIRNYGNTGYKKPNDHHFYVKVDSKTLQEPYVGFNENCEVTVSGTTVSDTKLKYDGSPEETKQAIKECIESNKVNISNYLKSYKEESISFENFIKWNGKIVKTNDDKFYEIKIEPVGTKYDDEYISSGDLFDAISNSFKEGGTFKNKWSGTFEDAIQVTTSSIRYKVTKTEVTSGVITYNYDFTSCEDIEDQPFGIIAFPYKSKDGELAVFDAEISRPFETDISMLIARKMCLKGIGQDKPIYDFQLLPYCPVDFEIAYNSEAEVYLISPSLSGLLASEYTYIRGSMSEPVGIAIHPKKSKFSKIVIYEDEDSEDIKVENQCTFYRLCSPNFSSQFEFNKAKNKGISYFNIDCTYRPYAPYIHVNPDFKGLYGSEYNDARGLICSGDFSMTAISDAFETYKLQNKNYQEIFNRQIENMDVHNSLSLVQQSAQAIANVGAGALSGALITKSPFGAIGGASASAVGGIADLVIGQKMFRENKDYAIDIHNYTLGNIKALPDTITKVDSYNNNNKIFPVLEKYSCTDEEKEIFRSKLKYEGMTVNAIATIEEYIGEEQTFVKGQMIRLDGLNEDNNFAIDVYNEISKGVYL